jgi:hypothetical protein
MQQNDMDSKLLELERKLQATNHRLSRALDEFGALKLLLEKNNTALEEFIELGKTFKFGLKILNVIEKAAVWVTKISLAVGALWGFWKFVILETIKNAK